MVAHSTEYWTRDQRSLGKNLSPAKDRHVCVGHLMDVKSVVVAMYSKFSSKLSHLGIPKRGSFFPRGGSNLLLHVCRLLFMGESETAGLLSSPSSALSATKQPTAGSCHYKKRYSLHTTAFHPWIAKILTGYTNQGRTGMHFTFGSVERNGGESQRRQNSNEYRIQKTFEGLHQQLCETESFEKAMIDLRHENDSEHCNL